MPLKFGEKEIEILRVGDHTSANGVKISFTKEDLEEIRDSYDPSNFRAPLIVSHKTGDYSDHEIVESELAFGTPKKLKMVGDRLKAVFDKIAPKFVGWVRDKQILSISPSIYLRESESNPSPGKLSLRHIAGLGKSPPAIKGMTPLSLSEAEQRRLSSDWAISLSEFDIGSDENSLSFSEAIDFAVPAYTFGSVADIFQNLREWLIDFKDMETADRVIPGFLLMSLRSINNDDTPWSDSDLVTRKDLHHIHDRIDRLSEDMYRLAEGGGNRTMMAAYAEYGEKTKMADWKKKMGSCDMGELSKECGIARTRLAKFAEGAEEPDEKEASAIETALKKLKGKADMTEEEMRAQIRAEMEAELADQRKAAAAALRAVEEQRVGDFVESLASKEHGGLLPKDKEDIKQVLLSLTDSQKLNFSEGGEISPRQRLMKFLGNLNPAVDYAERTAPTRNPDNNSVKVASFSAPDGFHVDPDDDKEYRMAVDYCEKHKLDPRDPDHMTQAYGFLSRGM